MNNATIRARLWDKDFKYVPAAETDISKLFARIKRQQKEQTQPAKPAATVTPIKRSAK